jgi:hypothetical protein
LKEKKEEIPMLAPKNLGAVLALLVVFASAIAAQTITTTKIINNGPDGGKLVFAILGDGYAAADQAKYRQDVDNLIVDGLLGHDFYRDSRTAFNVYRVDLMSNDSGVSTPGTTKDTSLKIVYTGLWKRCWLEGSSTTEELIDRALIGIAKYPDYVLVIANEDAYGGCHPGGNRLYVTSGSGWEVVAHEYGHAIGNLFDEYWNDDASAHDAHQVINMLNCSTELDKTRLSWSQFVSAGLNIPPMTEFGPGIDAHTTVGMFQGCDYESSGIYRPSYTCRMREVGSIFCPVCSALMGRVVAPFLASSAPPAGAAPPQHQAYLNLAMKVKEDGGSLLLKMGEDSGADIGRNESSSNFVFEVTRGSQTVGAGVLPEDPFVVRGFADRNNNQGEMRSRSKSATIVVKVPGLDLSEATTDNVGLRFYKVRLGGPINSDTTKIDVTTLNRLKEQGLVDKKFEISAGKMKKAALEMGVRNNQ